MAAEQSSRAIKRQLEQEVAEFRRNLASDLHYDVETWEKTLPTGVRDALAARALIHCNGDAFRAAARLGFGPLRTKHAQTVIFPRLFETEGVKAILARDLKEPEQNRQALIERMVNIAMYSDDSISVKAFQVLAKVCGWIRTPDVLVQNNRQTILALVTQKNARGEIPAEALDTLPAFLEHEPGAATRIDSGDYVALALGSGDEE
jgi:hypothetical protein